MGHDSEDIILRGCCNNMFLLLNGECNREVYKLGSVPASYKGRMSLSADIPKVIFSPRGRRSSVFGRYSVIWAYQSKAMVSSGSRYDGDSEQRRNWNRVRVTTRDKVFEKY